MKHMAVGQSKEELLQKRKAGRPREYDVDVIIQEMIEWSKDDDSINFAGFCADKGYLPELIWRLEKENQDFSDTYTLVKMRLAERRERYLNADALNYGSWQRYQGGYDPFLTKSEDEDKDKDAARKKGVVEQENANLCLIARMALEGSIRQKD